MKKWAKVLLTVVGAVVFSTLGIMASDMVRGIDSGAQVSRDGVCRAGMKAFRSGDTTLCVDMYEASASPQCPHAEPGNSIETDRNLSTGGCYAASAPAALPWRFVSLTQAQRLCAGAGKRLPTSEEWYRVALGTDEVGCNTHTDTLRPTGASTACLSTVGAYDLIGNVWEWVDATVVGYTYNNRPLPSEGYVGEVDSAGVAIRSVTGPDALYGEDYFWSKADGVFGMIRGGFYGSDNDAGLYTVNAAVPTSFAAPGVGFRCVEDIL